MNAPQFTGERYVPGQGGAQIAYEHLHRYLFARRWAREKLVLDVAAGTGYGSALLAKAARRVWAMDLDAEAVRCARAFSGSENLLFLTGEATCLPFSNASMELVVALEVLEHVSNPEALVRELARVVRADGVVVISTPDKAIYSDARQYTNPFHVHEFYFEELVALLGRHFSHVQLMRQQIRAGSLIVADGGPAQGFEIMTDPPPDRQRSPVQPMFLLAICGAKAPGDPPPASSAFLDLTDALEMEWRQEIAKLNNEILELGRWSGKLQKEMSDRDRTILAQQKEFEERTRWALSLQQEIERRDHALVQLQKEFEERTRWALSLQNEVAVREQRLNQMNDQLRQIGEHLGRIRRAFLYRVLSKLGILPK